MVTAEQERKAKEELKLKIAAEEYQDAVIQTAIAALVVVVIVYLLCCT